MSTKIVTKEEVERAIWLTVHNQIPLKWRRVHAANDPMLASAWTLENELRRILRAPEYCHRDDKGSHFSGAGRFVADVADAAAYLAAGRLTDALNALQGVERMTD